MKSKALNYLLSCFGMPGASRASSSGLPADVSIGQQNYCAQIRSTPALTPAVTSFRAMSDPCVAPVSLERLAVPSRKLRFPKPRVVRDYQRLRDSGAVRAYILKSSVDTLHSLGAGELARLSKIIVANTDDGLKGRYLKWLAGSNVQREVSIEKDMLIENKLQQAFGRAYHAAPVESGVLMLDRLIAAHHLTKDSATQANFLQLTDTDRDEICAFIVKNKGAYLKNLNKAELSAIFSALFPVDVSTAHTAQEAKALDFIRQKYLTASGQRLQPRQVVSQYRVDAEQPNRIYHKTTLFAVLNRQIDEGIDRDLINASGLVRWALKNRIAMCCLKASLNHIAPEALATELRDCVQSMPLSETGKQAIGQAVLRTVARFQPSDNLGLQMESPHARKLENEFSAMVYQKPTSAMTRVAQKIVHQLKQQNAFDELLNRYFSARQTSATYPVAQRRFESQEQIAQAIRSGSDLAIFMDFHNFCSWQYGTLPEIKELNNEEIIEAWHQETYRNRVQARRGPIVFLPVLSSLETYGRRFGIGLHSDAIRVSDPYVDIAKHRPSAFKTAFGSFAKEASQADAAQGCGITGQGNVHLWGQAIINQYYLDPADQLTEDETRVFLAMIATTMTADGGHSLGETIATAQEASDVARTTLSEKAKGVVGNFFQNVHQIAQRGEESLFAHYDMLFATDEKDTYAYWREAWHKTTHSLDASRLMLQ